MLSTIEGTIKWITAITVMRFLWVLCMVKVFIQEYAMSAGSNTVDLIVEDLNSGFYYLNVRVEDKLMTEKINILK